MAEQKKERQATPLQRLQAALAGLGYGLIGLLPVRAASALGGWLGRAIGPRVAKSRIARKNLRAAMPELDEAAIERIVHDMWENLGRTAFEYPHLHRFRLIEAGVAKSGEVELVNAEHLYAMRDDGRPGLFVSAHMANWEIAGECARASGLPLHLIYRAPNNPAMDSLFAKRHRSGELLPKGLYGARRAMKLLRNGEHLGVLIDQKMNDGIPVPFFGRDAMTAPAVAEFALRFDCPIVLTRIERLAGCRFRMTFDPPLVVDRTGDHERDVRAIMTAINERLEVWIRQRPAQWFWVHRRWPDS